MAVEALTPRAVKQFRQRLAFAVQRLSDVARSSLQRVRKRCAPLKYLHTMVRVTDVAASLRFYCDALGLEVLNKRDVSAGRYTLIFLAAPDDHRAQIELTHNWDPEVYDSGRNFGHLAYAVPDIYAACTRLRDHGVTINRPPRDGRMAFVRSPDNVSIELLQEGAALPATEPWLSMPNTGVW